MKCWILAGVLACALVPGTIRAAQTPVVVNEVLAHTDLPQVDYIELHNPTNVVVDLSGWYITDDFLTPRKFRIPAATVIPAGGYVSFDETQLGFALASGGDEAWLFATDGTTNLTGNFHGFRFGASENGVSFGRYLNSAGAEDFPAQLFNTPGAANSGPRVGPVVISEIMFRPPDLGTNDNVRDEFIELENIRTNTIALFDSFRPTNTWRFSNSVTFNFPTGATLQASARALVVSFDPNTNAPALAAFRATYPWSAGFPMFGPYSRSLSNAGARLELRKPDPLGPTNFPAPYVVVDAVDYRPGAPWPAGASGTGASLQKRLTSGYGNEPTNWIASRATPATRNVLLVVNTNDSGPGSLRSAITNANASPGPDTIAFNIPGAGVKPIAPFSALPTLTDPVVIDGYTQPGASVNTLANGDNAVPLVLLAGPSAGLAGLWLYTSNSVVRGLIISQFRGAGIRIESNGNNVVEGNFIGTGANGANAALNASDAIQIVVSSGNTIGGSTPAARNLIVATNGASGVRIDGAGIVASNNVIAGNFIGTDATGTLRLSGAINGVLVDRAPRNTIGGTTAGSRNVIAAAQVGVLVNRAASAVIQGNHIGTDVTGTRDLGHALYGVQILEAPNVIIGGTNPASRNVISGNDQAGVFIVGTNSTGNAVRGNFIGTDVTGMTNLPNGIGISLMDSLRNSVGAADPNARNVISGNSGAGVLISTVGFPAQGGSNSVSGNFIGTDVTGRRALPNQMGVHIFNMSSNTVGGTTLAARNVISGNSSNGVFLEGVTAARNTVLGNLVGTDVAGTNALPNSIGVHILQAPLNFIGGTIAGSGNVISGNSLHGVHLSGVFARTNIIAGNYIGTDAVGVRALGNARALPSDFTAGVLLFESPFNTVGGTNAAARNVVSGNQRAGIVVQGTNAAGNLIRANYVGTDATGTNGLGNGRRGIVILDAANTVVGGGTTNLRNVVSANVNEGVYISGARAVSNSILGNYIGPDTTGLRSLVNPATGHHGNHTGLRITNGASLNVVGTDFFNRNVIAGNEQDSVILNAPNNAVQSNLIGPGLSGSPGLISSGAAVLITSVGNSIAANSIAFHATNIVVVGSGSTNNAILINTVSSRGSPGIDLGLDGPTPNDPGDLDVGPNRLQNTPVIGLASGPSNSVRVAGTLSSAPNRAYRLEFFNSALPLPAGEGVLWVTNVTTDPTGIAPFSFIAPSPVPLGSYVTATATDPANNTSEFSQPVRVAALPVITAVSSLSGPVGAIITIFGSSLTAVPGPIVTFGSVRASVISSSSSNVVVVVPTNALFGPLCVTVSGLTACFELPFDPTYASDRVLDQTSFGPRVRLPANRPSGLKAADIDGDGKVDLVTLDEDFLVTYRNVGTNLIVTSNSFARTPHVTSFTVQAPGEPVDFAVGDLDGDGRPDVAAVNTAANFLTVFRNSSTAGNPSFAPGINVFVGSPTFGVAIGDLDADGRLDLAFTLRHTNLIGILRNTGVPGALDLDSFGSFTTLASGAEPFGIAIADLDYDDRPEIIATLFAADQGVIYGNQTTTPGTLSFASGLGFETDVAPIRVEAADLDGDGGLDLVVLNNADNGGTSESRVTVSHNDGALDFGTIIIADPEYLDVGASPVALALGDVDGDGRPDIAVANQAGCAAGLDCGLTLLRNRAVAGGFNSGSFGPRLDLDTGFGPIGVAVADLNGDGRPELVVANAPFAAAGIVILPNLIGPQVCAPVPDGLIAWWRAEGNALDAVGANHGVVVPNAGFAPGRVGMAFSFLGTNGHIDCPTATAIPNANAMTVQAWIHPTQSRNQRILTKTTGGPGGFLLELDNADHLVWSNGATNGALSSTSIQSVPINVWTHVAAVWDGRGDGKQVSLYINGQLDSSRGAAGVANDRPIRIGADAAGQRIFSGRVDEVAIWNRVLGDAEIEAIFNAGNLGLCPALATILVHGQPHPNETVTATNSALVQITSTFSNGVIRYTLNGAPPETGALYSNAFIVNQSVVVRAIAYSPDFAQAAEAAPVTIIVGQSPFILVQPQARTVGVSADVLFNVGAGGTPPLTYRWRRDGATIPGATNATLLLTNVIAANAGSYSVVVGNSFGSVLSATAVLVVLGPPNILTQPASVTTNVGGRAVFTVSATGPPPLQFQWRKNGVNIPGATNSTFTISDVQVADGASYTVVISSAGGTVVSGAAQLIFNVPSPPVADNFASASALTGSGGILSGTNVFATREFGEPPHAGKPGSNSVWFTWSATASGIALFQTLGSTFDTLLAVYTGTVVTNLASIASDDDSGGFLASEVRFNALSNVTYRVAIDGFNGQTGRFVLQWLVEQTTDTVPVITCHPANRTVMAGSNATFTVGATGNGLTYRWLINGSDITGVGATLATYTRTNVQPADVGFYSVRVTSGSGRAALSLPAILEIGPFPGVQSRDKSDDVFAICAGGLAGGAGFFGPATGGGGSVAAGSIGYQNLVTLSTNNTIDCITTNCGGIPTGTRIYPLEPAENGTFVLDTVGSASRTKLWICDAGVDRLDRTRIFIKCDVESAPDGRSRVGFPAVGGRIYHAWVSKLDNASGQLRLNWALGDPPAFAETPTNRFVLEGDSTVLSARATNRVATGVTVALAPPTYHWSFNGTNVPAVGGNLVLAQLKPSDAGLYTLTASNEIGTTTTVVRVAVLPPAAREVVATGDDVEMFALDALALCGTEPVKYQWRLNGTPMVAETGPALALHDVQPEQAGEYTVAVTNCVGATIYVVAQIAVTVDVGFAVEFVGTGEIMLQWRTGTNKRYRVEYRDAMLPPAWATLGTFSVTSATTLVVSDYITTAQRFYRIVVLN